MGSNMLSVCECEVPYPFQDKGGTGDDPRGQIPMTILKTGLTQPHTIAFSVKMLYNCMFRSRAKSANVICLQNGFANEEDMPLFRLHSLMFC